MARSAVPSQTGGRQLGDLDLDEHLAKFRDRQLVLIVALISGVAPATVSGIRGLAMNEVGECPRCKLEISERAREVVYTGEDWGIDGELPAARPDALRYYGDSGTT